MVGERRQSRQVAAHAMDATARRRRGAAQIQARVAGAVEVCGGAGKQLRNGHLAAGDVAAHIVGVPGLELRGVAGVAGEDAVVETGGEPGYLIFDNVG